MIDSSFYDGQLDGFYECHDITTEVIRKLRNSLEEVWSIEQCDVYAVKNNSYQEKLNFAINTLVHLEEMFQDKYDSGLGIIKSHIESLED